MVIGRLPDRPTFPQGLPADQRAPEREERLVDVGPLFNRFLLGRPLGGDECRADVRWVRRNFCTRGYSKTGTGRLTSLQQRLVKTGGRLVKHARYYCLLLAEGHLNRRRFGAMLLPGGMGLAVLDVENVVRHYSYTGLGWLRRFQEKRSTLNPARYDRI
jgi:hypothetical protein